MIDVAVSQEDRARIRALFYPFDEFVVIILHLDEGRVFDREQIDRSADGDEQNQNDRRYTSRNYVLPGFEIPKFDERVAAENVYDDEPEIDEFVVCQDLFAKPEAVCKRQQDRNRGEEAPLHTRCKIESDSEQHPLKSKGVKRPGEHIENACVLDDKSPMEHRVADGFHLACPEIYDLRQRNYRCGHAERDDLSAESREQCKHRCENSRGA